MKCGESLSQHLTSMVQLMMTKRLCKQFFDNGHPIMARDFTIREFTMSDFERVLEIRRSSLVRDFEMFGFSEKSFRNQLWLYLFIKIVARLTGNVSVKIYVGDFEGLVLGTTTLSKKGDVWDISAVMVDPMHRRKSYGKKLVSRACNDARRFGAKRVVLRVLEDNVPAKELYKSLNFMKFERIAYFRKAACRMEEKKPLSDYKLVKIDASDYRVSKVINACRDAASAKVYGRSQVISVRTKWFTTIFRNYIALFIRVFRTGKVERYAIVRNGRWIGVYTFSFKSKEESSNISLYLHKRYRGQEIEEAVVIKALNKAFELGAPQLTIAFNEENFELEQACKKLGFRLMCVMEGMFKNLRARIRGTR